MTKESFLDRAIRQLDDTNRDLLACSNANDSINEFRLAADARTGDYPQAKEPGESAFLRDGGLYYDRLPVITKRPIPFQLKPYAKWTDVVSSSPFSHALLLSDRAAECFNKFEPAKNIIIPATVSDSHESRAFSYLFLGNHLQTEDVNFAESTFVITGALGEPKRVVQVNTADEYWEIADLAMDGELPGCDEFSTLTVSGLKVNQSVLSRYAFFGLGRLGRQMYVNCELAQLLRANAISGIDLLPNTNVL